MEKKEVKKNKKRETSIKPEISLEEPKEEEEEEKEGNMIIIQSSSEKWKTNNSEDSVVELKTREDVFESYLEDLLM